MSGKGQEVFGLVVINFFFIFSGFPFMYPPSLFYILIFSSVSFLGTGLLMSPLAALSPMIWREHWCLYCCEKLTDCREATEGLAEMWILRVRADWLSQDFFHFHFHFLFMCFQRTCVGGGKKGQEAFGCYMFWHVLSSFCLGLWQLPTLASSSTLNSERLWLRAEKIGWRSLSASMEGFQLASRWGFQALSIPQLAKPRCHIRLP